MNYTKDELVNMVYCLGEADRNVLLAQRIYKANYPDLRTPDKRSVQQLKDRFEDSGNINYQKKEIRNRRIPEEAELHVLLHIQENPTISTREIAREVEISKSSVNRTILKHKFHPYHLELHQELYPADFPKRVEFCEHLIGLTNADCRFYDQILFSDEATFKSNGTVNRHNMHYYSVENPHWMRTVDYQNRWSLNVWGGILAGHVIGPFFFDDVLNGERYLEFLRNDLPLLLEDANLNIRRIMWLQQDGAPVHYYRLVRRYLDEVFPNRWIGRNGPIPWPARSPDLTPIDFFLWGFVKERVYQWRPTTKEDMKARITDAFRSITPHVLTLVKASFNKRLGYCLYENGNLFEHLLK